MTRRRRFALVLGVALLNGGTIAVACSSADQADLIQKCADRAQFAAVSPVLEQRCGTLDCHGSYARPLRIYGSVGLRRPEPATTDAVAEYAEYYPGGAEPTTVRELDDNYRSVCSVEPEIMNAVVEGSSTAEDLTLVRKPLLLEKHKGGRIFEKGTDGIVCITSWLQGTVQTARCEAELKHP
jgi:hypothetical protein